MNGRNVLHRVLPPDVPPVDPAPVEDVGARPSALLFSLGAALIMAGLVFVGVMALL